MVHRTKRFTKKWGISEENFDKFVCKLAENRKKCSCYMCGNARRMMKERTMQEIKFEEYAKGDE